MKKFLKLLLILSLLTTISCSSCPEAIEYELPEEPKRELIEEPETVEDLAKLILYYEKLLQEWESWGKAVKSLIAE